MAWVDVARPLSALILPFLLFQIGLLGNHVSVPASVAILSVSFALWFDRKDTEVEISDEGRFVCRVCEIIDKKDAGSLKCLLTEFAERSERREIWDLLVTQLEANSFAVILDLFTGPDIKSWRRLFSKYLGRDYKKSEFDDKFVQFCAISYDYAYIEEMMEDPVFWYIDFLVRNDGDSLKCMSSVLSGYEGVMFCAILQNFSRCFGRSELKIDDATVNDVSQMYFKVGFSALMQLMKVQHIDDCFHDSALDICWRTFDDLIRNVKWTSLSDAIDKEDIGQGLRGWNMLTKWKIVFRVLFAMRYCHRKGIPHGNLSSSAILLDDTFEPNITGFGIVRIDGNNVIRQDEKDGSDKPIDSSDLCDMKRKDSRAVGEIMASCFKRGADVPDMCLKLLNKCKDNNKRDDTKEEDNPPSFEEFVSILSKGVQICDFPSLSAPDLKSLRITVARYEVLYT